MVANYFLGGVVLILTTDTSFGDVCWCREAVYVECLSCYSSDCCSADSITSIWHMPTTMPPDYSNSGSATNGSATTIGASVGGALGFAVLVFFIIAWVRYKRGQQGAVVECHRQLQAQPQPPSRPTNGSILLIVCRRIFVRRSSVPPDMENPIANPELNPDFPQTGTYAYEQEHVIPVAPPPYTPASLYVPPPPYSKNI